MKTRKSIFLVFVSLLLVINLLNFVEASCIGSTYTFSCGDTINESCSLNANEAITGNCYTIGNSNIVISGNNHLIDSDATSGIGFNISNVDNITIQNITFTDFGNSIFANSVKNITLKNIIANENINLSNSWYGNLSNISTTTYSEFKNVSRVNITDMNKVIFKDNTFDGSTYPSYGNNYEYRFTRVNDTLFTNYSFIKSKGLLSYWYGNNLTIENSEIKNITNTAGIASYFTSNILIRNNTLENISYTSTWSLQNDAIYISGGDGTEMNIENVTIYNNTFNQIGHWDTIFTDITNISNINISNNDLSDLCSQSGITGGIVFYYSSLLSNLHFENNIGSSKYELYSTPPAILNNTFKNNINITYLSDKMCFDNITNNTNIATYSGDIIACSSAINVSDNTNLDLIINNSNLGTLIYSNNEIDDFTLYQNSSVLTSNLDFGSVFGEDFSTIELQITSPYNISNITLNGPLRLYGNASYYINIYDVINTTIYDFSISNLSNISAETYSVDIGYSGWEPPEYRVYKYIYDSNLTNVTADLDWGDINLINTSVNLFDNRLIDNSSISQYWYVDTYVEDEDSNPIEDAEVLFNLINKTTISLDITEPIGLTSDEDYFYVVDDFDSILYKYLFSTGEYVTQYNIVANSPEPYNLAVNDNYIYVIDGLEIAIQRYTHSGVYVDQFDTSASGASSPRGIAVNGTNIFVVDRTDNEVYIYYLNGTYTGNHFDTASSGNTAPRGIAQDGTYIWIIDYSGKEVYRYYLNGTYSGFSFNTIPFGNYYPYGISVDDNNVYVSDYYDKVIYNYTKTGFYNYQYVDLGNYLENTYTTYETLETNLSGYTERILLPSFFENKNSYMNYTYSILASKEDLYSDSSPYNSLNNNITDDETEISLVIETIDRCFSDDGWFTCGDYIYEDCEFVSNITCDDNGFTLAFDDVSIDGNGYTLTTTSDDTYAFRIEDGMEDNSIYDLNIESNEYAFYFSADSNEILNVYNSSFDDDEIDFYLTSSARLNNYYYLDVYVYDTVEYPVDGATVYLTSDLGTTTTETTDTTGYIPRQTLLEYYEVVTGKVWYSPYTAYALKDNLTSENQTFTLDRSLIETERIDIILFIGDTTDYYLDLYHVFVNEISGSEWIFIFLSLTLIVFFGAKFRFPNNIILLICIIWLVCLSQFMETATLLPVVILLSGIFIGWTLIKVLTR